MSNTGLQIARNLERQFSYNGFATQGVDALMYRDDTYAHGLPVRNGPYTMANADVRALDTTVVRLVAADGADLWPVSLNRKMNSLLNGRNCAKAARDLIGRSLGVNVAGLLGGAQTDQAPSSNATGVGAPDGIARLAKEKRDEGYHRLQVKVGGRPVDIDIETTRKVWEVVRGSGMCVAVDGNRGWATRDALWVSRECPEIPFIMEQPRNTVQDLEKIRPQGRLCNLHGRKQHRPEHRDFGRRHRAGRRVRDEGHAYRWLAEHAHLPGHPRGAQPAAYLR